MKTNTTIFGKSASTIGGPRAMIAMNTNGTFEVANIDFSSTNKRSVMSAIRGDITSVKALDVVDTISVSGEGLPTEQAVANAAYWIEVGRFTARQSGAGNKYDFIALKNAGYKYARVRENRTGGYCGADIDLSKVTASTQIKLVDKAAFFSSTRIDIISITQHSADVTTGDFIFYKLSITISGTSASYELKTSGETETLIVEARK